MGMGLGVNPSEGRTLVMRGAEGQDYSEMAGAPGAALGSPGGSPVGLPPREPRDPSTARGGQPGGS